MTIAYVISSFNYGGAEKQTVLDANMMVSENEVFFFYFTDGPQMEILDKAVHIIQLHKWNYLSTSYNLARQIKKHNIQIVHSSLFASMIISALSSLLCNVNIIWHFHSHEYDLPLLHQKSFKWLARLSSIRKICFVNTELIQYYQEKGFFFPQHKIQLLYNNAVVQTSGIRAKKNDKRIIGYIGRLVSLKRVEYLIELAQFLVNKQYTDFQIQIVGDGKQRVQLEHASSKNGMQSYVSFLRFNNDVDKFYAGFDIFVNPSQEECLSIALIDAGICGIPSVAFDVGGNNEIIKNNESGYIVKHKEEFFEKILLLLNRKNLREEMGKKAIEHCQKHFTAEVHFQQLQNLYREVIR